MCELCEFKKFNAYCVWMLSKYVKFLSKDDGVVLRLALAPEFELTRFSMMNTCLG